MLVKCPHLLHAERGNVELPRVPAVDGAHDQGEQVGEAAMILLAGWLVPSRCVVRDPRVRLAVDEAVRMTSPGADWAVAGGQPAAAAVDQLRGYLEIGGEADDDFAEGPAVLGPAPR